MIGFPALMESATIRDVSKSSASVSEKGKRESNSYRRSLKQQSKMSQSENHLKAVYGQLSLMRTMNDTFRTVYPDQNWKRSLRRRCRTANIQVQTRELILRLVLYLKVLRNTQQVPHIDIHLGTSGSVYASDNRSAI